MSLHFRSGSSSSGDNLTDDSGIHSKSTSKDSPRLITKSIIKYDQPVKIERVAVGRRPVRKLPAVPASNSKQAHIVQLKPFEHKKLRALPKLPQQQAEDNNNNNSNSNPAKESTSSPTKVGLRLSNFFRSVKFPRNSKKVIQPAPVRIFGRELNDLVKATNQEGEKYPLCLTSKTLFD